MLSRKLSHLYGEQKTVSRYREGDHVVLFTFDDKSEMEKILVAEPWSFDKYLMVLQSYDKETDLTEMEFKWPTFWV